VLIVERASAGRRRNHEQQEQVIAELPFEIGETPRAALIELKRPR
jgi:hypothetical protein